MPSKNQFQQVFKQLRSILKKFERRLKVQTDAKDKYYLDTKVVGKNKKPICFGAVAVKKNYVSFYLMSVYGCPELIKGMSPKLKSRMQGKACFNFTTVDAELFEELARLTEKSLEPFLSAIE